MSTRKRILIFTHDGRGLGHLRRLSRIAGHLQSQASVLFASGHREVAQMVPRGCEFVHLPSLDSIDTKRSRQWGRTPFLMDDAERGWKLRIALLTTIMDVFDPDGFISDYLPLGIEQELIPLLAHSQRCRNYFIVRGVLDHPDHTNAHVLTQQGRRALKEFYKLIFATCDTRIVETGRLRVAINLGNSVLAQRTEAGELTGVSVFLAKTLARELNLPLDMTAYNAAGMVFDALDKSAWDVAFLAIEPERATRVDFSQPYVVIDGTYLVRKDAPFQKAADLDRAGIRIAVSRGAAYDLYLSRTLKHAELLRALNSPAAIQMFLDEHLDAAAGVRQALADFARDRPELKVLEDSFSRIEQAIGIPRGRAAGAAYIRTFLERMRATGETRRALDASGQKAAQLAPHAS